MSKVTGKKVTRMRGWEYLKQMEYTLKVPIPEPDEFSLTETISVLRFVPKTNFIDYHGNF